MSGGDGNDVYHVDNVNDTVTERSAEGTDTIYSSVSYTAAANVENLTSTGSNNIFGIGNYGNNTLTGNSGHNRLSGEDGNDTLYGMSGDDTLSGGNGYDYLNGGDGDDYIAGGSGSDTITYYVADVKLTNATDLRSAFANNSYGTNIVAKPSAMASEHDAVLAINGDYYGFRSDGILIRNGVIYRDSGTRDGMAFYSDGRVEVYDETTTKAQTLLDAGVWNTLSFGPALVNNSKVLSGIDQVEVDTNVGNHSIQGQQPRTAVGWVETNHLKLVVVDGRNEGYSRGVTMTELAQIMADLGCACAYNIDGGGSSAMYFNGSIINQPSNGGERDTSDILYIANGA